MYVFYNETGKITGTYDGEIEVFENPPTYVETGMVANDIGELSDWEVIGGVLTRARVSAAIKNTVTVMNQRVEEIRLRFITGIVGQDAIYQAKRDEAVRYIATDPEPLDLAEFPFLAGEVGVTAADANSLSQLWLNMNSLWMQVAGALESIRITHVSQVESATTIEQIETAETAFNGTLDVAFPQT